METAQSKSSDRAQGNTRDIFESRELESLSRPWCFYFPHSIMSDIADIVRAIGQ